MRRAFMLMAAGSGSRFGGAMPKQFLPLMGRPLLLWSLGVAKRSGFDLLAAVVAADFREQAEELLRGSGLGDVLILEGGSSRQESVLKGLEGLTSSLSEEDLVVIHDAARPLLREEVLEEVVVAAESCGAATAAVPASETLARSLDGKRVLLVPRREELYHLRTPQAFRFGLIWKAHKECTSRGISATDDVGVVVLAGHEVAMVLDDPYNIKVTFPRDIALCEAVLAGRLFGGDSPWT